MQVIRVKNYKVLSEKASAVVIREIKKKPNLSIAFATGRTPKGLYKLLIKAYRKKQIDFSKIKVFNLDEYYSVSKKNRKSFYYYLHKRFLDKVDVKKKNICLVDGEARDWRKESRDYENKIKKNPIDLMILGVGVNGHIAFNEPGSAFDSQTRLVELDNKKKALTIGISTILSSKKILLLAFGKSKADAINRLVKGKETSDYPVSFLRKHKNLAVIVDRGAGSLLS